MTKEITKANIIQEIQDKLKLRELEPEIFAFSELVVPTYNIESHLEKAMILRTRKSITATGGIQYFIVPGNERWKLNGYNVVFLGAGAITVAGVYLLRAAHAINFLYLDLTAAQTVSYANILSAPLLMLPGDAIYINIDGYTSTQDLDMHIDVIKEEIR